MAKAKAALAPRKSRAPRSSIHRREAVEGTPHLRPGLSFPVVAIGASAGGLAAFTELLKALPSKTGMAFVLIQHLEPKHESALTSLLSNATSMPVVEVYEGMDVEPNYVYVIPPNKGMTIREGVLRLTPRSAGAGLQRPIDDFFIASAEEQGEAAIGVVLSGTGSDGTYGLKAIKAAGGVTFAQDPKTAQWSDMPMGVITAGSVDFVVSPERIAKELAHIGRHPYLAEARDMPERSELDKVCLILRSAVGIDFRLYKQATVRRRIARRMALRKIASLNKYAQNLKQNPEEAQALAGDIFIHVTSSFRDPECFQALRKKVLAKLRLERKQAQEKELHILRAFVERAPMAVIMLDRRMRGVQVSQQWLDDMCMTREFVLGRSHYECFPDLPAHWEGFHRRSLAGESLSGHEESYVRPDGRVQCINWRMVPWGDSGVSTGGILISYEDVTQRKHAEEEARQSAATIRTLIESAPQSVIAVSEDETIRFANGNTEAMFGYKREELLGRPLAILLPESVRGRHAEHHKVYFANMQNRPMGLGLAFEARRRDGTIFPVDISLSVIDTPSGKLAVAFVADITQRKRLEERAKAYAEQVQALAARLLTAQEDERRRVSRELHDQICQQLASLAIDIGRLAANPPSSEDAPKLLKVLQRRIVKASEEARHIAYELHPSMLDDLGLATALRALCKEFSAQHLDTKLRFSGGAEPTSVPREVASCVFRVALESLQNIAKHSKAKHVSVALAAEKGSVALTIADDGAGFDLKAVQGRGGLGLIGMQERVRLLNGKVTITARPGHGTRIALVIPVLESSR